MMKKTILESLSKQVNAEWYSSYLYLAMSADCDRKGFKGLANWMYAQAQEELAHGTHIYEFILERGEAPIFYDIAASKKTEWANFTEMFEEALAHEQHVTGLINQIASLAMKEADHATYQFIQWYVSEQVEEEATADGIVQTLKYMDEDKSVLYNLDRELGTRVFINPFNKETE